MKILLSAYACEPNKGSELGVGWNFAHYIAKLGHEVWVLTRPDGREAIEKAVKDFYISNIHFVYIKANSYTRKVFKGEAGVRIQYNQWQWKAYKEAKKLDCSVNFDIVHHLTWGSLQQGSWLWLLKKPFMFGPVGGGQVAPKAFKKYLFEGWKQELVRSFIGYKLVHISPSRLAIRKSRILLATNDETADLARKLGAKRIEMMLDSSVSQDYIPQEFPLRSKDKNEIRVLWVGRLLYRKGISLFLETISKIDEKLPIRFIIVGDGPSKNHLLRLIHELKLSGRVEWLGQIPWEDVKNEYLNSDIFVFTSLRDSFGAQILEAASFGLPLITLNHHGSKTFVPDLASIKIDVTTPDEVTTNMSNAIVKLYKEPDMRITMGKCAYEFAVNNTWGKKAKKINQYYNECL